MYYTVITLTIRDTPMTRWLPGQSRNPHGRPRRGQALTDAILRFSRQKITALVLALAAIRFCSIGPGVPSVMIPPVLDLESPYLDEPFYDRCRREPWVW